MEESQSSKGSRAPSSDFTCDFHLSPLQHMILNGFNRQENSVDADVKPSQSMLAGRSSVLTSNCRGLSFNGTVTAAKSNDEDEFYCKDGKELCSMIVACTSVGLDRQ
uniref:Uncharacterized protein n=1 Tax=Glossina pallidipes TaxID=7398 RepID=A0A1A9ZN17_GLOPL